MQPRIFPLLFLIFILTCCIQCDSKETSKQNNANEFSSLIQSYGPTSASKNESIFVELKQEFASKLTTSDIGKYCKISPSVKGAFSLKNQNFIMFQPTETLESSESYTVSIDLRSMLDDTSLPRQEFQFPVTVIPQRASLSVKDYYYADEQWNLDISMKLNDQETLQKLKESISIRQGNKDLPFTIQNENAYNPIIQIIDIKSVGSNNELLLTVAKEDLDLSKSKTLSFSIPDPDTFELLNTKENKKDKTVEFIFTQLLDKSQNLSGLIRIKKQSKSPKYKITDNKLTIFLANSNDDQVINISPNVLSKEGSKLKSDIKYVIGKLDLLPSLKNVGIGHIIPDNDKVVFPFEAQGLNSVSLEIFQIYSENLQQFYQQNTLRNAYDLDYVGEVVHTQNLDLNELSNSFDPYEMKRYYFDVKDFISKDANAVYEIRLGFLPEDTALDCIDNMEGLDEYSGSIFDSDYYGVYGYYDDYSWKDSENPCKKAYYNKRNFINKIVMTTNLGVIAKKGEDGSLTVFVNDLITTKSLAGVDIEVYNKSQRSIASTKTDKEGHAYLSNVENAFMLKSTKDNEESWLRLQSNDALDINKFDVGGRSKKDGFDGFIYGERNIWRPGDSLFIDFMLFDPDNKLPNNHPVKMVLENPEGSRVFEETSIQNFGPLYSFIIPTKTSFLTGDYLLKAKVGASDFSKFIKIENIKPNKFSIVSNLKSKSWNTQSIKNNGKVDFEVNWLYGAPAKNKRLVAELDIDKYSTRFEGYNDYRFVDPRNDWRSPESKVIADVKTNESGKASVKVQLPKELNAPGKVLLKIKSTAYESSGDFSADQSITTFDPYTSYVGLKLPDDNYGGKRTDLDAVTKIEIANVDSDGRSKKGSLKAKIYRMERYWWWNSYNDEFDMTNMEAHVSQNEYSIQTALDGTGSFDVSFSSYGRYYIQVCDSESGHCTGDYLYVGYAWDDGEMSMNAYEEAAQLSFTSSNKEYSVGETVELNIPSYFQGKALVSLENGTGVVESFWTTIERGNNKIPFTAQLTMFPTIYAHVTMIQAHKDKANDIPIRSYGILPINIKDNSLELQPVINTSTSIKPNERYSIEISEESGKDMYYTLAVVDEGLLNLSNFKTPNPFDHFYSKPSLGVRTYDMYNDVMTAYGNDIDKLFSIGGDLEIIAIKNDSKANRFSPVVKHIGPFYLPKGQRLKHEFTMPNYIGAVRMMVVAGKDKAFGSKEVIVPVKQDLMIMATLPRQLSPGDKLNVPLTLISMKDNGIGNVQYGVKSENNLINFNNASGNLKMNQSDEQLKFLSAQVGQDEGKAVLDFYANTNTLNSNQKIEIQVENSNPVIRRYQNFYVGAGESVEMNLNPIGSSNSEFTIGVSSLSPINMENHIDYLTRYPYGCLEQRTSAAFAILYQEELIEIDERQKTRGKVIVEDLLNDLYRFKKSNGYGLWPGNLYSDNWLTSYVGEFLITAEEKGYSIPSSILSDWKSDQLALAGNWTIKKRASTYQINQGIYNQAYRLYALARSGNAALNEMNRLKEDYKLNNEQALILAAAYVEAGRKDLANSVQSNAESASNSYNYSYGSKARNLAIQAIMNYKIGDKEAMSESFVALNKELSNSSYLSTQTAAFVLRALAIIDKQSSNDKIQIDFVRDNLNSQSLSSNKNNVSIDGELATTSKFRFTNKGDKPVYIQSVTRGKENNGQEKSSNSNLDILTKYQDLSGNSLDPKTLSQGVDFYMVTTVTKDKSTTSKTFENLVLRQILPAGWEITNDRIYSSQSSVQSGLDYQDIKDNKVYSFFSLENKDQIQITIKLKATYLGEYYHPKLIAESMYENDIFSEQKGFSVTVIQ